jgi:hypothetical protein
VVPGLFGFQSQALPYLILGVIQRRASPASLVMQPHLRPSSADDGAEEGRPCLYHEGHVLWESGWVGCCSVLSDTLLAGQAPLLVRWAEKRQKLLCFYYPSPVSSGGETLQGL